VPAGLLVDLLDRDADRVERLERGPQLVEVPVLDAVALRRRTGHIGGDDVVDHVADLLVQIGALEDLASLAVDHLALLVEDLVVLQDVLADLEVLRLDLRLRAADRPVTIFDSIGTSSGMFSRSMIDSTAAALNSRIRSSPSER
jgi:hypothetical protein